MITKTDRPPVSIRWTGGMMAGYIILDSQNEEICRVWSEKQADWVFEQEQFDTEWLVGTVLQKRFGLGYLVTAITKKET